MPQLKLLGIDAPPSAIILNLINSQSPMKMFVQIALFLPIVGVVAGCFAPPMTQPPTDEQQRVIIPLPYDLAWDAVNSVIRENGLRIQAQDSNHGIIEAVGSRFTLHEADCGKVKSIVGTYAAEPELNATSVYNFLVRPHGRAASVVEVRSTFSSPVKVPLRPAKDVDCVSRGTEESNLMREVLVQAKKTHRPVFTQPSESTEKSPSDAASPTPPATPPASLGKETTTLGKSIAPSSPFTLSPGATSTLLRDTPRSTISNDSRP
jgi:hypothetical protein